MYIIGIDIALRKTGITLINPNGDILYYDTIIIPDKLGYIESMVLIDSKITEVYDFITKKFSLSGVLTVIEDVANFVHIKSALAIHAARTAATLAVTSHTSNLGIVYYTPNEVKLFFTGKRSANKEELQKALAVKYPRYSFDSMNEDEIDALALTLYHKEGGKIDKPVSGTKRRRLPKRS